MRMAQIETNWKETDVMKTFQKGLVYWAPGAMWCADDVELYQEENETKPKQQKYFSSSASILSL